MENKNPLRSDGSSRAERIRTAAQELRAAPLDRTLAEAQWDRLTADLTPADLDHLKSMAEACRGRAEKAVSHDEREEAIEEATNAVLLWPRDGTWALAVSAVLDPWKSDPAVLAFRSALRQRSGRSSRPRKSAWWTWGVLAVLCLLVGWALALLIVRGHGEGGASAAVLGPRDLGAAFDTQGVKTNIAVAQSRLLLFPEATVAELSAWVVFPDDKIGLWQGKVSVLDTNGKTLAERNVTFHKADDPPLDPGQGVAVFQQFDAWPWFDKVSSFQLTTTRILADPAHPVVKTPVSYQADPPLPDGYNLKIWSLDRQWTERFVAHVHTWSLEFENAGLQPFQELTFHLVWTSPQGRTLKTLTVRPVVSYRSPLAPGSRLAWHQETVFETEVFSWDAGQEPIPHWELVSWR